MSSRRDESLPPPKNPFPENSKLRTTAGYTGIQDWFQVLRKYCPPELQKFCKLFIEGTPPTSPTEPAEHDQIKVTSYKPPVSLRTRPTPIKLATDFDPKTFDDLPPLVSSPLPNETNTNTRTMHRYDHDVEGFITQIGLTHLLSDQASFKVTEYRHHKDSRSFFDWVVLHTLHTTTQDLLEADPNWKSIHDSADQLELLLLLNKRITSPSSLRSLQSLSDILDCKQGTKSHAAFTKQLTTRVQALQQNFAGAIPNTIDVDKLHAALILHNTANNKFVENYLVNSPGDIATVLPSILYDKIQEHNVNALSYASATKPNNRNSNTTTTKSTSPSPESKTGGHVLALPLKSGLPQIDKNLMTSTFPHMRPKGSSSLKSHQNVDDVCTHCLKNGYVLTNHNATECFELRAYNEKFGGQAGGAPGSASPSLPTTPRSAQRDLTAALLNKTGDKIIKLKSSSSKNSFAALQSVTNDLNTDVADYDSEDSN